MLSQLINKRFRLSLLLVLAILVVTSAGCSPTVGLDTKTRDVIQHAIDELNNQPGAWQGTMTNTIDELGRVGTDTAHKVLADVQSVYNSALGQTQSAAFCGADFIGRRLKQKLQAILHTIDPKANAPVILPVVCSTNPGDHIEPGKTQQVTYYGYDFLEFSRNGTFSTNLEYAASGQVVRQSFGFVAIPHNYELTVDIQAVNFSNVDKSKGPQLVLKWGGQSVASEGAQSALPIIFAPPTPTRTPTPTPLPPSNKFKIDVTTGDVNNAGTNANVFITLFGDSASSDEKQLDTPNHDDFERGKTDTFNILTSRNLGNLTRIRIRHDNSGFYKGWFLERIVITNVDTGRRWTFNAHRWLATDEGDHAIDVLLTPN